jgi:choline monooxygenase
MAEEGFSTDLRAVHEAEYHLECNWKVFASNYLDGGYHVPELHRGLSTALELDTYSIEVHDGYSIQRCAGGAPAEGDVPGRVAGQAFYAYVHPNLMINRYGKWMDVNTVWPTGANSCRVQFDYFLESDADLSPGGYCYAGVCRL